MSTDPVITIARKDRRASEVIASLKKARDIVANPANSDFLRGLKAKEIPLMEAALKAAGIAEDAVINPVSTKSHREEVRDSLRRPANPWRAVGRMDAEAGDINHLLRCNGNSAAAE